MSLGYPGRGSTHFGELAHGYEEGFLTSVTGYAPAIGYHANEMLASVAHANGVTDVWSQDPDGMRRPAQIETQGAATGNFDTGDYAYDGAGNIVAMGADRFVYDGVSRLAAAVVYVSGVEHSQTQTYDAFGNRIGVGGTTGMRSIKTDPATNRLLGSLEVPVGYDAAGNVTSRGGTTHSYDGLHMMNRLEAPTAAPSAVDDFYIYTADDERIAIRSLTSETNSWTLRDLDGGLLRQLEETSGDVWSWTRDTIRRDGQLLATEVGVPGGTQVSHYHLDHLGTPRLLTRAGGEIVVRHTLLPFVRSRSRCRRILSRFDLPGTSGM